MNTGLQDRLVQRSLARKLVQDSADLVARARETVADCRNTCYTISLQRTLAQMLAERQAKP